ncbi:MAG: twitching motility protein PilT [Gammaproteobacteria bacterium RIFCSPHIGHO2_12_FULL_38_14]|nr:MAG: twitching motility protein PilT [Gammaproteobacteria bacterium RIFCSPHIGHO2_12_FULL_38_14]
MEISELLKVGVKQRASDLHLLPDRTPMLRIDGDLVNIKNVTPLSKETTKELVYSVMTPEQQAAFETHLVLDIGIHLPKIGNFRVSVLHQMNGIAAVFRMIPERIPSFDELGLPTILKSLLVLSHGLIFVSGPTGSGKSTTLAAMVDYINTIQARHIITVEDPIEYVFEKKKSAINQLQIGRDTPSVAIALRAALRQDPDVILLGEIRDMETVNLALTAAETGHLVMATIHAGSAPLSISRIVDLFPISEKDRVRNLLSEALQAVICQNLVKKASGGRVGVFEIMLATPAIRHLIRQDKIPHMTTTIQTNGHLGMCTMDQYLNELLSKGIITLAVARSVAVNQGTFRS